MKKILKSFALLGLGLISIQSFSADQSRFGTAGFEQLRINSFARSSGWGSANVAGVRGAESFYLNPAGLARTPQSEFLFARSAHMVGTDININNFSFSQSIGKSGSDVIGISLMSMEIGNIDITTTNQPEGGIGTYRPSIMNLGFGYGRRFTNSISGGVIGRIAQEQVPDVRATSFVFDAGVQYAASSKADNIKKDDLKFGIALRNIGPNARPFGDGLTRKARIQDADFESSIYMRPDDIQNSSLIHIGGAYDMKLDSDSEVYFNRLTFAANFNFNAYAPNQTTVGLEYAYKELFMVRAGYYFQEGGFAYESRNDAFTGFSAGLTVEVPFAGKKAESSDNKSSIAFDYSYRDTNPFGGTHTFGLRINLDNKGNSKVQ